MGLTDSRYQIVDHRQPFHVREPPLDVVDAFDVELPAGDPRAVSVLEERVDEDLITESGQRADKRLAVALEDDHPRGAGPELEGGEVLRACLVGRRRQDSLVQVRVVRPQCAFELSQQRANARFVVRLDGDAPPPC